MLTQEQPDRSWKNFLALLDQNLDKDELEAWVAKLKLVKFRPDEVVIGGLNQFFCNWIRDHHRNLFREGLFKAFASHSLDPEFKLVLKVGDEEKTTEPSVPVQNKVSSATSGLDSRHRIEFFVCGNNNKIAYAAAQSVAENSAKYNPLFLCGDVGLGKTHLMQAIGIEIRERAPGNKILYTTSEEFTNEVINGIRFGKIHQVRERYRSLDLLLIDDIHFLENKESTQEEFFHTFNVLIQNQKQVVLTADRYPKEIKNIEDRLTSRFSSGMVARIEPPDFETRVAIIRNEIDRMKIPMNDEVIDYVAVQVKSNVRDIKGILIRMEAEWSLLGKPIGVENTKLVLKEVLNLEAKPKGVDDIIKTVCAKFSVKVSDIKSDKRDREISNARQIAMYLTREITDLSFPVIGRHFGGKNHTSVLQACKKTKLLMETDPESKQTITAIARELSV